MFSWKEYRGKRICVAVSGGEDSVALLHYLKTREAAEGYTLFAVHCEHGIRGEESLKDMRFVVDLCEKLNVPLYTFSGNCPQRAEREKVSLETAARNFRRESFASLINENKVDFIATAHHQNDEAETVLFRIARGASLTGMVAIKEKSGYYIRPFLQWSKREISQYISECGLSFRLDKTNLQTDATRNKIRLEILPKLEEAVGGAVGNIARFATLAAEDDELLYALSEKLLVEERGVVTVAFSDKKPLFTRACLSAMKSLGVVKDYERSHLNGLFVLQNSERGASLSLPQGLRAEKTEKGIAFFYPTEEKFLSKPEETPFTLQGFDGGRYEVSVSFVPPKIVDGEWKTLKIDGDKLPNTAKFRFRKKGDEIQSFGGRKTLKKFFNEKKIPPKERDFLPLIADEGGEVYAVCGVELSQRIKLDETTRRVLYITIRKKENE